MSQTFTMGHGNECAAICDALGLKNVRRLSLSIEVGEAVSVTVEKFVTTDELDRLRLVIEKYDLIAATDTSTIGDQCSSMRRPLR